MQNEVSNTTRDIAVLRRMGGADWRAPTEVWAVVEWLCAPERLEVVLRAALRGYPIPDRAQDAVGEHVLKVAERAYATFKPWLVGMGIESEDIVDVPGLRSKLANTEAGRHVAPAAGATGEESDAEPAASHLAQRLTRSVNGAFLYEGKAFANADLSPDAHAFLSSLRQADHENFAWSHLNRWLVEAALSGHVRERCPFLCWFVTGVVRRAWDLRARDGRMGDLPPGRPAPVGEVQTEQSLVAAIQRLTPSQKVLLAMHSDRVDGADLWAQAGPAVAHLLTAGRRRVVETRLAGLPAAATAVRLGMTEGNVYVAWHRAKRVIERAAWRETSDAQKRRLALDYRQAIAAAIEGDTGTADDDLGQIRYDRGWQELIALWLAGE